ncbi:tRNA U34 5-methylaminomethyl-2-thiouridine-forming methyltransferase MnmC [Cohaesibacter marisflavi]|uniref:tRNA U34 5-methylaminomethyl-2-thiouridine-forming methyltransferase MnmC n=1 Tax=Cohaesibacter marisflavi TaxID=655353 RepID=A0A1I5FFW7_9HYPH|nr:tRNA (5-methylaminomethyl-2-thiouridine)(34)-methyltransferase MnmD [Cohaesibacter marisflavi]SFO22523.1 tRNA U34 5-methylaminomethyl-2-thiouridine-forming methyltransferase MnmC [Cohaesibacter marisflavi]
MAKPPELVWLDNLTPKSTRFDDTYYTRENGLDETRYVFIDGNRLPERWLNGQSVTIGELGFGTGLNFLATWQAWHDTLNDCTMSQGTNAPSLTYISFEKYPLDQESLAKALSPWPDLAELANKLVEEWKPNSEGWLKFDFNSVALHLYIGDAADGIKTIPSSIDAWFLDGFNPKTNPELWSETLMQSVYDASNPEATLASYTAAGWVRRNLQSAGFSIAKRKGFGHKRDMITGSR